MNAMEQLLILIALAIVGRLSCHQYIPSVALQKQVSAHYNNRSGSDRVPLQSQCGFVQQEAIIVHLASVLSKCGITDRVQLHPHRQGNTKSHLGMHRAFVNAVPRPPCGFAADHEYATICCKADTSTNGLHPHRQGNTTSHLVMHRAFVKAGIMPYPAFSRNYMLQCRYVNAIKKYKVGDAAF
ncbi:hypothetical protein T01_5113 [Trichinella spiralis]|uniref:Uncharacterized protein n=1 Tax=Trichinella spiralis TaxID=6334 RepID=A0A0V1AZ85_TRISP|nr:hypothetical protein T01_5113 [Trichinella spiralis]